MIFLVLFAMLPGMLALFLIMKHEKKSSIPIWVLIVFMIPILGYIGYLVKYFIIDKRREL